MAKAIHQFRFYNNSDDDSRNEPQGTHLEEFVNGDLFKSYYPIYQLGIQTLPGVRFYLNGSEEAVIMGATGIYELDLSDGVEVTTLMFDKISMDMIDKATDGYLLIDMIYENGEDDD